MFYGGLTYSSHPVSLAAALATIGVYEEDGLIDNAARLGERMREHHERLAAKHPSVGAHRNLGLFGILDLVRSRDPWTPMTPFNGTSDEMKAIGAYFRDHGVYTMIANNSIHTNPPLCITEERARRGLRDHRCAPSTSPTRRSRASVALRTARARVPAGPPRRAAGARRAADTGASIG